MESAIQHEYAARRPIPSLFIGVILLFFSSGALLLRLFNSELTSSDNLITAPTTSSLLLTLLAGVYLLACVHREKQQRLLHQRVFGSLMVITSAILLFPALRGSPLMLGIEVPAIDTLIAFLIAGCAALLNPSVRTLSQLAAIFMLILLLATLAMAAITNHILDYDPFFTWRTTRHMSPALATGLLLFAIGLSYTSWWCHRQRVFDPVSGITLIASILLIFSALLGAGLIYTIAASYLHVEMRNNISTLISERSDRIVTQLRHGQEFSQLLIEEAQHSPEHALRHTGVTDYALRITRSDGSILAERNGEWFNQKTIAAITHHQTTLWRGEKGHCQLRLSQQAGDGLIETSTSLDLSPILDARQHNRDTDDLTLCAYLPDGGLRCLSHDDGQRTVPELLANDRSGRFRSGNSTLLFGEGAIQAVMPIPEFGLVAYMEKSNQEIFGPLYQRLYLVLPLALLLLGAGVGLIAWRIHPLAKQLHRSEHRYRTLVGGAADAIILHDENRRFVETNQAAATLLGYERNELTGMHPDDFLLPQDHNDAHEQIQRLHGEGSMINTRRKLKRKDGTLATVEIRATLLDSGMSISVVRDISEQMEIEAAVREQELFIRSVVEVLAEGVVVHQADGAIIYTNRAALQILGYADLTTSVVTVYDTNWAFIHDDESPFDPAQHPAMLALGHGLSQRNVVMGVMRPDGNRIWLSVNSDPLRDERSNTIIGAVVSFSDITQKREIERQLHLKRERLRALSNHLLHVREEEKSSIAREIHDELGSSLTAIKMGIEWIDEKIPEQHQELKQRMEQVTEVTAHAIQATRRLVTQLRPSVLEDLGLWAALEWQMREFGKHSNIHCKQNMQCSHIHLPPQTALVVYRVIQETLNNIAKHAQANTVRLECWYSNGHLNITLEDDGIGIDEEVMHSITSYGIRGMYERIIQINGKLQILGTPGEGTLVVLTLPCPQLAEVTSL